jgi:hypothetical protein
MLFLSAIAYPQAKVKLKLMDPGIDSSGKFYFNLVAAIQPGQIWKVGTSNIRVTFRTIPGNGLTPIGGLVDHPLECINSSGYASLNIIILSGGATISFNITRLGTCCTLSTGAYVLGRIRFNIINPSCCTIDSILTNSVIQDSNTVLAHGSGWLDSNYSTCIYVGTEQQEAIIPEVYHLYQNNPNPFNPETVIKFDIPKETDVRLVVNDILGSEVALLVNKHLKPGTYETEFDGSNYPSGVYFYKLESSYFAETKKMILIK